MFAYIPARSGSKRIKNKNIKLLMGRPIISWVIEKIKEAELVEDIYVSTDDEAIAEISIKYGGLFGGFLGALGLHFALFFRVRF